MFNWLRTLFRKRRVIYPFRAMLDEMKAKDAALYAVVAPMPVATGIDRWRQKYPEDFVDG